MVIWKCKTATPRTASGISRRGLVGMLAVVALASLWPSLAAARKTVSDILRYQ